jgi:excisionase family DNA binding protein
MDEELLTIAKTAEYLQFSIKTVRRLISNNKIRASKLSNRSWRIRKYDVDAYIMENSNLPNKHESETF